MSASAWQLQHSVEADVSPEFAWSYWTDVSHWEDPPAQFSLDGPFAAGTVGTTRMPDQEARRWTVAAVRPGESYRLEVALEGAVLSFDWSFAAAPGGRTRLTQRISLSGENAAALQDGVAAGFGPTLAPGMARIAGLIERAARRPAQITGIAPQFLVDDLDRAIAYYRDRLGFELDFKYESFYAGVRRDGFAIHLKHAAKLAAERAHRKQNEHLDAYIEVSGIQGLFSELQRRGAEVTKPLGERPWACLDFYVEDADGYILCFSEPIA
jgi:catechol 2,3-dioxygenase-like lactoylglutathione lyase family enzyme